MEHAEARERLADAATDRSRFAALLDRQPHAPGPGTATIVASDDALREHLATCDVCRHDLGRWRATIDALEDALAAPDPFHGAAPADPAGLRAATIGRVERAGAERPAALRTGLARAGAAAPVAGRSRPRLHGLQLAGMAAAVVLLVAGGLAVRNLSAERDDAIAEAARTSEVAADVDEVLLDPAAKVVTLASSSQAGAGTLLWGPTSHQIVVLSRSLQPPPAGQVYSCWFEDGGHRDVIGRMWFNGTVAYWGGSLDAWNWGDPSGLVFGISLEPKGAEPIGAPVLTGRL
jgi:hypothetical protein